MPLEYNFFLGVVGAKLSARETLEYYTVLNKGSVNIEMYSAKKTIK